MLRMLMLSIWISSLVVSGRALAVDAADVNFDDSATTEIVGADVQAALESADGALATLEADLDTLDTDLGTETATRAAETTALGSDLAAEAVTRAAETAALDADVAVLEDIHSVQDPDAAVAFLRKDCTGIGSCFVTTAALTNWIWNTRQPSQLSPLLVDVGPGEFGVFICDGGSDVAIRGSGREQSIFKDTVGVSVTDCDRLSFMNIGMHGDLAGVIWVGAGRSDWSDVDIIATGSGGQVTSAWLDACSSSSERGLHYFHGSRVHVTGPSTYIWAFSSQCGESWFYGGDIFADVTSVNGTIETVHLNGDEDRFGDLRIFGTTVRTRINAAITQGFGAHVYNFGVFHAHGSIINTSTVPSLVADVNVIGISVGLNSLAHTPGTAFVLKASGTGTTERLRVTGNGKTDSPFLWQSGSTPPASTTETNVLASVDGEDIYVETDCDSAGDCNGGGSETHMMIYNAAFCPSSNPWFDTTVGACRQ